ncbi:hypothetical protein HN832_04690 [archaeon]|jgi:hypothetical protein|nr:hypothetical protein [archaeon]MBT4373986.1 hypothetical protein [archaeon]MBT4532082.1 hypothetical protein [archaeon]MBT7001972.1 hypothetical protein [archaeon]MBT7282683.1 hypothetical protein [archaeon]
MDSFDTLTILLGYFPEEFIPDSTPAIHNALYELSQRKEYKKTFPKVVFKNKTDYRYSLEIAADFRNMEICEWISSNDQNLMISPALRRRAKEKEQTISEQKRATLEKMAQEFSALLG